MGLFPKNARVCFIGDSITHGNAEMSYVANIIAYYHEHHPELGVMIYNCGVSGGSAESQTLFLEEDVFPRNPTHAVIMLGVNDSGRWVLSQPQSAERYEYLTERYREYTAKMETLCRRLIERGIDVTLCTPMPYAEYQQEGDAPLRGGYALMQGYAEYCRRLAEKLNRPLCDYHAAATRQLQIEGFYKPDRIHPTARGHFYMAKWFMAFQGEDMIEDKPIPDWMSEWSEKNNILRNLYATEWMLIPDKTLTVAERLDYMADYYKNQKYIGEHTEFFKKLAEQYQVWAPKKQALMTEVDGLMAAWVKPD